VLVLLKKIIVLFLPAYFFRMLKSKKQKRQLADWYLSGCPIPPPHIVKQNTIEAYRQKSGYTVFIETGTFMGEMVDAQKSRFERVISIELGQDLFIKAQKKFARDKNVTIVQGDSGKVLVEIMRHINEPAIFWLDGHYSGGITAKGEKNSPIFEELKAIFSDKFNNHIILIDDARDFVGKGDYPTISEISDFINGINENYRIMVENDIIRCFV